MLKVFAVLIIFILQQNLVAIETAASSDDAVEDVSTRISNKFMDILRASGLQSRDFLSPNNDLSMVENYMKSQERAANSSSNSTRPPIPMFTKAPEPNNPTWTIIFSIVGVIAALGLIVFGISMFFCFKSNRN